MNTADKTRSLGFIGTGAIAQALIIGMIEHGQIEWPVKVSRRSGKRSSQLEQKFSNVEVLDDNQAIVDNSDWVFLAVLPEQAVEVIQQLSFKSETVLISLVAGISVDQLKQLAGVDLLTALFHCRRLNLV